MIKDIRQEREELHAGIYRQIKDLFQIKDMRGVEVLASLTRAAQLCEMVDGQQFDIQGLSMPRWRLMLHLFIGEQFGKTGGVTPTELSHFQQVSKNTISSLLRGLEEQGYIQREIDPDDLRVFRIHLTEAGRQLIMKTAPSRIESLNRMLSGMTDEEVATLTHLLHKLRHSLEDQFCQVQKDPACRDL